jgi:hypothetical protein
MNIFPKSYSVLLAIPLLAGKMSEVSPQTPVMDLVWWAWLLIVGGAILVVGLAIAWQAHLVKQSQAEHSDEATEHYDA